MKYHSQSRFMIHLMFFLLMIGVQPAFAGHLKDEPEKKQSVGKGSRAMFDLSVSTAYRIDQLDWSISGFSPISGNFINILSELSWEDLEIHQIKVGGHLSLPLSSRPYSIYSRASLSYGKIMEGNNQDSDFDGVNRSLEFSRSVNRADQGTVLDGTVGAGFELVRRVRRKKWILRFAPLIGYSHHQQNLKMTDGFQVIPLAGAFPGLDSSYEATWSGPWLGFDISIDDGKKTTFFGSFEYHLATSYEAEADWNLRTDFAHPVSFRHEADGSGVVMMVGWAYLIGSDFSVNASIEYQRWITQLGIDTTFLSDGRSGTTPLNEVNWESRSIALGLEYHFN